jgi:hypothetical protein
MVEPVVMRQTNLKDVSATLRIIADAIDSNEYGDVRAAVVVLDAFKLELFFMGEGEAGPETHLLLGVGQHKMAKMILDAKEPDA